MARRKRRDEPGAHYHVMNRGVARRTIFDTRSDFRYFLACLACAVRRAEIELLAYALMRTHFHLFVRSLGGLSDAMRRVQLRYVRRFNRLRGRDGPLMRGRFLACRGRGPRHTRNVVRYTHENPVLARLCRQPEEYEWSSARLLRPGARTPKWFSDREIQRHCWIEGAGPRPRAKAMHARAELVEARLKAPKEPDEESLDASTPERVLAWMRRKAELADGSCSGLPEVGPRALVRAIHVEYPGVTTARTPVPGAGTYDTSELLVSGLLREVACCAYERIAHTLDLDVRRVARLVRLHRRCVNLLPTYAQIAAEIVAVCIEDLDDGEELLPGTNPTQL